MVLFHDFLKLYPHYDNIDEFLSNIDLGKNSFSSSLDIGCGQKIKNPFLADQICGVDLIDFDNVVKTSIFLSDMSLFNEVNGIYGKYIIKGDEPARETIAVKTLPMNVNVEISMIAIL